MPFGRLVLAIGAAFLLAVPTAMGGGPTAVPAVAGQRIDLKVLLLSPTANDGVAAAWKAALEREGVPYDTYVAGQPSPITDGMLADYSAHRAKYQAVISAWGDMPLATGEQVALAKLETTFGIRQINDNSYPSAKYGLNAPVNAGEQGGNIGTLSRGRKARVPAT